MVETAGYVPVALSAGDYIELLPATWRAINAYGVKINYRTYDDDALNPLRLQRSGVTDRRDLWEIHYDPYDVSQVWVRDHWRGGWITLFWKQLHRIAAPFGELAWDHARKSMPGAIEAGLANAVEDCSPAPARDLATGTGKDPRSASGTGASLPAPDPFSPPARQSQGWRGRRSLRVRGPLEGKPGRLRSSRCRSSTRSGRRRNGGDPACH